LRLLGLFFIARLHPRLVEMGVLDGFASGLAVGVYADSLLVQKITVAGVERA
jgi:hypothetical protein